MTRARLALVVAVVAVSTPSQAGTVELDVACDRPVDTDALTAQLALELSGSAWSLATTTADATLAVRTADCAENAPIELALRARDGGDWSVTVDLSKLPRERRPRLLAIVIAELLRSGRPARPTPALVAPFVPPAVPAPPVPTIAAPAIVEPTIVVAPVGEPPPHAWSAAILATTRTLSDSRFAAGAALSLAARARHHLVVDLDAGLEQLWWDQSPVPFGVFHADGSAGAAFAITTRATIELGARVSALRLWPIGTRTTVIAVSASPQPWTGAAGLYARATVHLARRTAAVVDLGLVGAFDKAAVPVRWTGPVTPGPYAIEPLYGVALVASAGFAFD